MRRAERVDSPVAIPDIKGLVALGRKIHLSITRHGVFTRPDPNSDIGRHPSTMSRKPLADLPGCYSSAGTMPGLDT